MYKIKTYSESQICVYRGYVPVMRTIMPNRSESRKSLIKWIDRKIKRDKHCVPVISAEVGE